MPFKRNPRNENEYLQAQIDALKKEVNDLKKRSRPTMPIYDWNNLPVDAIEGQVAIIVNAPADTTT